MSDKDLEIKIGDIVNCVEDAIIHQVNCVNAMGAGVAKALYIKWPQVKSEYHKFCNNKQPATLLGYIQIIQADGKIIFNAFSQLECGCNKVYTDYNAVEKCFELAFSQMSVYNIDRIAIPYLYGCGLAGGDWNVVSELIKKVFGDKAICYKL